MLSLWLLAATSTFPAESIEQIEACMRANVPSSLQVKAFELTVRDKAGGTRTLVGRLYGRSEEGRIQGSMKIDEPLDMRGAAYLLRESPQGREEEMYVYLPALQKVRRITGGMRDSSLFGTDLSYADIRQITYAFSGDRLKLERTDTLENRPMWVLSMAPDPDKAPRFDKVMAWVDRQSCMLIRAEFSQAGAVRKKFTSSTQHLQQSGPYWYVNEGLIEDLAEKTSTHLKITEVLSDKELTDRLFNPRAFYLGQ